MDNKYKVAYIAACKALLEVNCVCKLAEPFIKQIARDVVANMFSIPVSEIDGYIYPPESPAKVEQIF